MNSLLRMASTLSRRATIRNLTAVGKSSANRSPNSVARHLIACPTRTLDNVSGPISIRSFSSYPAHTVFTMPALSPTMERGRISSWIKQEGDEFIAGDVLCSIETDKATMDFEAQDDGYVAKILIGENEDEFDVGVPICVIVEEKEHLGKFDDFSADVGAADSADESAAATESVDTPSNVSPSTGHDLGNFVLTPAARFMSHSKGLDASVLYPGSGMKGRVTKGDIILAIENGTHLPQLNQSTQPPQVSLPTPPTNPIPQTPPPPKPTAPVTVAPPDMTQLSANNPHTDTPNNNMRKIIARRLTESKATVPHFYVTSSIILDPVLNIRKLINTEHLKTSVNDYIVKASSLALRDVPEMNAYFDLKSNQTNTNSTVDICIAVATPTGLITPIVPNTDKLGLGEINAKIKDLATRARDNKLKPEEYQGGTFTISNLGMFGIQEFSAVINPPQCAILAVGGGVREIHPSLYKENEEEQEGVEVRTIMKVRLSADRRVVDEATASLFLQSLKLYLEEPKAMIL